jgi:hypothetical protein
MLYIERRSEEISTADGRSLTQMEEGMNDGTVGFLDF